MQQTERPLRESLLISSERAASILLHLFATRLSLLLALQDTQHRQLHTAQERHQQRAQHPDTRRQIARDTPHLFIPAREAGFPFRSGVQLDHVFYLATNKHLKYETQGEVVSLA